MIFYGKKIIFIGAHPDDIELGCGAFISNILGSTDLLCVTLSDNQKNPALRNLMEEHYRSMDVLGVPRQNVILKDFETRKFPHARQEILEFLFQLNREHRPDIVFTHTRSDIHQDHATATDETLRAFRGTTVLGFDCLRSSYGFFPHFLAEVGEKDVECKVSALAEYKTYADKYYFDAQILRATLVRHGALAERPYAEGFDILRVVGNFAECLSTTGKGSLQR
jgi:N-acetylglucosamine malate deacetylase 1